MEFDCKYNYPQIARDSGFKFQLWRNGLLDWGLIGSLEAEEIIREQQFEKIDDVLFYLSEAPLAPALEVNILDSSVGKKFLDESVKALRESLVNIQMENENLKALNLDHSNEIIQLQKKINRLEAINDIIFPCHICTKNFVSNDALTMHLLKKHSNTPIDFQTTNCDRSLINTIKLELEIKHLKERLNTAEKYIRETSDSKMLCSSKCTKIVSSTQINTVNVEKGTQCNLFETKEVDSTMDEANMNVFITELQDKILTLESWKDAHRLENKESIDNISKSLRLINESLHSRYDQDFQNLKKILVDAVLSLKSNEIIPSTIKEFQFFLSSTFSDLMQQNSEKLNKILNKVETAYEEKVLYSQCNMQDNSLHTSTTAQKLHSTYTDLHNHSKYTFEKPPKNENRLTDNSLKITPINESDLENTLLTKTAQINEMLRKELVSYGLNIDTKTISTIEVADLSSQLLKNRNNMQKINPKFITTRNKLKDFINNHIIKNWNDENVHKYSLNDFKTHFIYLRNTTSKKDGCTGTDPFKERLERILCSPIKKPYIYARTYTIETKKPVPLPRKRVMFHGSPKTEL